MTEVADRTDGQETVVCRAELQGLETGPGVGLHDGVESGLDLLETSPSRTSPKPPQNITEAKLEAFLGQLWM